MRDLSYDECLHCRQRLEILFVKFRLAALQLISASNWTPSIVPDSYGRNVYIVLDDFAGKGRSYRETDVERANLEAVIMDLLEGQYRHCRKVVPGRFGRSCPRTAPTLRSATSRRTFLPGGFRRAARRRSHDIQLPLPLRLV
jgi:hypothetical protein